MHYENNCYIILCRTLYGMSLFLFFSRRRLLFPPGAAYLQAPLTRPSAVQSSALLQCCRCPERGRGRGWAILLKWIYEVKGEPGTKDLRNLRSSAVKSWSVLSAAYQKAARRFLLFYLPLLLLQVSCTLLQ
jgi:hypothetical protein